jgi:alanine-synthesizing transaminase
MALKFIKPAVRTENVTYAIRDIIVLANEVAKTGKELLYLNIGDPNVYDHITPKHIIEATYKAMLENKNGYASSSGIKSALDSIAKDAERKGIKNILDIFVTTGASEAIELCLNALLNDGENFLMPTPGYPLYTAIESKLMLKGNPYYLDEKNNWAPDIEDIKSKINDKTKAIIIINPNNPTGAVYEEKVLKDLLDLAVENNLVVFADEIYDKLLFDGKRHISIASLNPDASVITFSGLSKNYVVPGWRIGWGIVSGRMEILSDYIEAINKLLRARISASHPMQWAIPVALDGDQSHIVELNKTLMRRRDISYDMIQKIDGIELVNPQGAFYAFASIDVKNDTHFVTELIKATGVVLVPGSGFGQKPGESHFRFVILPTEDTLTRAFNYIGEFYQDYKKKFE